LKTPPCKASPQQFGGLKMTAVEANFCQRKVGQVTFFKKAICKLTDRSVSKFKGCIFEMTS